MWLPIAFRPKKTAKFLTRNAMLEDPRLHWIFYIFFVGVPFIFPGRLLSGTSGEYDWRVLFCTPFTNEADVRSQRFHIVLFEETKTTYIHEQHE